MATAPSSTETLKLDRTDGSATLELYRAALGPMRRDYYLKAFTRFDAAGKTGASWNAVAGLFTIQWLAFHKLWAAALAYVGALVFAALLLLGIGRVLFHLDDTALIALGGLAWVASVAVPGLWGNAWLYTALSQHIEKALVDSATLEDACATLAHQTGGRRRMAGLAGGNVTLLAAVAGLFYGWPDTASLPLNSSKMAAARTATPDNTASVLAHPSAATASSPQTAPANSAAPMPSAPVQPVQAPHEEAIANAARVSKGSVQQAISPVPAAVTTAAAVAAPAREEKSTVPTVPVTALAKSDKAASPSQSEPPAQPANAAKSETPVPADKAQKVVKPEKSGMKDKKPAADTLKKPEKTKPTREPAKAKALTVTASKPTQALVPESAPAPAPSKSATQASDKFLINVGLFSDSNNARNAVAKLQDAGLPVLSNTLKSPKGERTRVRVGPYETQAEADRVAESIQAMRLEAVVVKP